MSTDVLKQRDTSLDIVKGFACLLMVLVHTPYIGIYESELSFIGALAPIFFAGVAGITTSFQIRGRGLKYIIVFYAIFFLLSFSLNGAVGHNIYNHPQVTILHMIALGTIFTAMIIRVFGLNRTVMIFWCILTYLIHYIHLKTNIISSFPLDQYIIVISSRSDFALFPWVSFFFFGLLLVLTDKFRTRLVYYGASLLLIILDIITLSQPFVKWDMTISYWLLGLLIFGVIFEISKYVKSYYLIFFGQRSLLFYYASWFSIFFFTYILHPDMKNPVVYLVITITTYIGMLMLEHLNKHISWLAEHTWWWVCIIIIIFILPVFGKEVFTILTYYIIGFYFSMNYRTLGKVIINHLRGRTGFLI